MLISILSAALLGAASDMPDIAAEKRAVAAIDTAYQAAVERNDAHEMGEILHEDFTLVLGTGVVYNREDLLKSAREKHVLFQAQVEDPGTQTVRMYGPDVAIVTARLWLKGAYASGETFDRRLWFSDTYVRTPAGWKYAFGQASISLPGDQ